MYFFKLLFIFSSYFRLRHTDGDVPLADPRISTVRLCAGGCGCHGDGVRFGRGVGSALLAQARCVSEATRSEDTMNGGKYVSRRDSKSARSAGGPNARSAEAREPREDVTDRSSGKNRGANGAVVEEQLAVSSEQD